jgi:hypothetical protein
VISSISQPLSTVATHTCTKIGIFEGSAKYFCHPTVSITLCTGILRFGGLLGLIWLGAWTTENFSMQHARSLGAFSDLLSPNSLSQLATNHESASASMELLATHLTLLGKSNQIRPSRPPNLKILCKGIADKDFGYKPLYYKLGVC